MVNFADVKWLPVKAEDYDAISESVFDTLDEPTMLRIFSLVGQPDLENVSQTCQLFRRISYDRSLIKDDYRRLSEVLPRLLEKFTNKDELLADFKRLNEGDDILPFKLIKLVHWMKGLFKELPFYVMVDWAPNIEQIEGAEKSAEFLRVSYEKVWKDFVARELRDYRHISLGFEYQDQAFVVFLNELKKIRDIPSLSVGEELSAAQVEMLAVAIETGALRITSFSFSGDAPLDHQKQDRLLLALTQSDALKELSFSMSDIQDREMDRIAEHMEGHPSLESITLGGFAFGEQGIDRLLGLYTGLTPLSKLILSGCNGFEIERLLRGLNGRALEKLSLSCLHLTPEIERIIIDTFNGVKTVKSFQLHYRDFAARLSFAHIENSIVDSANYAVTKREAHLIRITETQIATETCFRRH